jgi:hypothetical protein
VPGEIVRTQRLEVVDREGRLRLLAGDVTGRDGPGEAFGFVLVDGARRRAWLSLDAEGPKMEFDRGGNTIVVLGVLDDGPEVGPYMHLCDANGAPVLSCRVEEDGSVSVRTSPLR